MSMERQQPRESTKRPYEKPELTRVQVDPVRDLLFTGTKTSEADPRCGAGPYGT